MIRYSRSVDNRSRGASIIGLYARRIPLQNYVQTQKTLTLGALLYTNYKAYARYFEHQVVLCTVKNTPKNGLNDKTGAFSATETLKSPPVTKNKNSLTVNKLSRRVLITHLGYVVTNRVTQSILAKHATWS